MNVNTEAEPRCLKNKDRLIKSLSSLSRIFVIFLYAYIILYVFFLPVDEEPEHSRSDWCEEYHPDLTYGECSNVAGW
jgi:hypothetical protein